MPIASFVDTLHIPGWLCAEEATFLIEAVINHPVGGLCVDMGSYAGRSSACLAYACQLRADHSRVFSIEAYDSMLTQTGMVNAEAYWANLRALDLDGWVTQFVERSPGASRWVRDEEACLIFIDADHEYDSVRADLAAWVPKLMPGGVLAMHDFSREFEQGQVWQAAHDALPEATFTELDTPTGFGWWTKPHQGEN